MQTVQVTNLATGEERTYMDMICPTEAVIYAWLNEQGRNNTHEYPRLYNENYSKITWGEKTVAMGDWCALRLAEDNCECGGKVSQSNDGRTTFLMCESCLKVHSREIPIS